MAATGWSKRYFKILVRKGKLPPPDVPHRNGRNGREPGWTIERLPEEVRKKISDEAKDTVEVADPVPGEAAEKPGEALIPAVPAIPEVQPAPVPEKFERIAYLRADLLRHLRADLSRNGRKKSEIITQFLEAYNTGLLLPQIHRELGKVSRSTLYEWLKKENESGIAGLAPSYGGIGNSKITEEEKNTLMGLLLHQNRIKIFSAIRLMKYVLKSRNIESPSSPTTLRRFVEKFRKEHFDIWTLFREGEKALNDKVLPYIERNRELLEVGEGLVADGHRLNFNVLNPFTGKPCRPALILFLDWRSGYPLGWEIMLEENVQCISSALRMAILALGRIPKWVLIDNGKAFKAKVFTSDVNLEEAGLYGMYARLGIQAHFAMPYNAQAKPIERFFRTFTDWFERLQPSFTGSCIDDKPAHLMRNEKLLRSLHSGFVPTIQETMEMIGKWKEFFIDEPSRGLSGKTPREVFAQGTANRADGKEILPADLHFLMMAMEPRKLNRNGVSFLGRNWYSDALYGLKDYVIIRYSFSDLSRIYIFSRNNEFLCEARPAGKIHPMMSETDAPDFDAMKREMARKRALKKETLRVTRLLGKDADKALPWTEIVPTVPDVVGAIEKAERERTPAMLNPSPFGEETQNFTADPGETVEKKNAKEPNGGRPWFFDEYEKYDWLMKQETLTAEDREWIDDFRSRSSLYKHERFDDGAELDARVAAQA